MFSAEPAVEAGRDALRGRTNYPWYDRQKDDVRPLNLAPEKSVDPTNRQSKWKTKTTAPKANTGGGRATSSGLGPLFQTLGIMLLISLLALIAYLVARTFMQNEIAGGVGSQVIEMSSRDVDRVEKLPFNVKRPGGDLLSEARAAYEAGNFSEAVIYLYSYYLVQLDKQHLIRLAKGKTNRQYLRELRAQPALHETLKITMIAFEDVFFGHHPLSREQFEACWRRLEEFQREVAQREALAA